MDSLPTMYTLYKSLSDTNWEMAISYSTLAWVIYQCLIWQNSMSDFVFIHVDMHVTPTGTMAPVDATGNVYSPAQKLNSSLSN